MPGMEWAEKDSMSNEHARDRGPQWHLRADDKPKFLPTGSCCLFNLTYSLQLSRSGPQPGKFWSSKCRVVKFEMDFKQATVDKSHCH